MPDDRLVVVGLVVAVLMAGPSLFRGPADMTRHICRRFKVHNPEEAERGRDLSTRAPMLALVAAVVATTRPTAGPTRAVPDTPDRTLPASSPAVLPRGREEEVGAAGRRVATGHL